MLRMSTGRSFQIVAGHLEICSYFRTILTQAVMLKLGDFAGKDSSNITATIVTTRWVVYTRTWPRCKYTQCTAEFLQKSDCSLPDFSGILFIFRPMWTKTLQNWLLNAVISYTMHSSILNTELDSTFSTVNFRCFVSWTARKLKRIGNQQCNWHLHFPGQHYSFQQFFPDFSIPMIIFKTFQRLDNLYTKLKDFPYFSRICTNAVYIRCPRHNSNDDYLWL